MALLRFCNSKGDGIDKDEAEGLAWLYVSSFSGYTGSKEDIERDEKKLGSELTAKAKERAKEIQKAIAARQKKAEEK